MKDAPRKSEELNENDAEEEESEARDAFCAEVEEKGLEKSFSSYKKYCP